MKSEFDGPINNNNLGLKCFQGSLWYRQEREMLKRILLAEAYHDVLSEKEGVFPSDISALDPTSSLYKAIHDGVRGNPDYPSQHLVMTQEEKAALQADVRLYAQNYIDAYVVAAQCGLLESTPPAVAANEARAPSPAGVFTDELFAKLQAETDLVIFICYDTYLRNDKAFTGADPKPMYGIEKVTSYRNL